MPKKFEAWDPFEPERKRRPWLKLFGAVTLAGVLAAGYGVYLLTRTTAHSPALLPATTRCFFAFTPGTAALVGVPALRRAYPDLLTLDAFTDLRARMQRDLGLDVETDVLPWLGPEVAIALSPASRAALRPVDFSLADPGPDASLLFASRDAGKARAALAKVKATRAAHGNPSQAARYAGVAYDLYPDGRALGLVGDFVVWASREEALQAMIDRSSGRLKDTLQAAPEYQAVVARLPGNALGRLFINGEVVGDHVRGFDPMPGSGMRMPSDEASAVKAIGGALSLQRHAVTMDLLTHFDLAQLPALWRDHLADWRHGVDRRLVEQLPGSALAAVSFRLPPDTPGLASGFVRRQGPPAALHGVDLERDLCAWLEGDVALAALPGQDGLPVEAVLAMRPANQQAAEAGLARLREAVANELAPSLPPIPGWTPRLRMPAILTPYTFYAVQDGGIDWQLLHDGVHDLGGYGWRRGTLYLAVGAYAAHVLGHEPTLGATPRFRDAHATLPGTNGGELFLDFAGAREELEGRFPLLATPDFERATRPLGALAAAGPPGLDDQGVMSTRVTLTLEDAPTK